MKTVINNSITMQNRSFTSISKPNMAVNTKKASHLTCKNSLPVLNAAYFHPTFLGNTQQIEEFSGLLDFARNNTKKITPKLLKKLNYLFKSALDITIKNEKAFINNGKDANVYRLDDKYVFKVSKSGNITDNGFQIVDDTIGQKLKCWYGGAIAKIKNVSILKNADPERIATQVGVPFNMNDWEKIKEHYKTICLPKLAIMPQEAFNEVASDLKRLNILSSKNNISFAFDIFNPNNFLLVGDKIRIVDDLDIIGKKRYNNMASMLDPFIGKIHVASSAVFDKALIPQRKNILEKCILASERAELPIDFSLTQDDVIGESINLAGIKQDYDVILDTLAKFRKTVPNLEKRINAVKEYLDKLS